jgi:5'-AMP-activated protein kinase, regulatory beta subunit
LPTQTEIVWRHAGSRVEVEGSYDNWKTRQELKQQDGAFIIFAYMPPGVYQVH